MNTPTTRKAKALKELAFEAVFESTKMGREVDRLSNTLRSTTFAMRGPAWVVAKMIKRINFLEAERAVFKELAVSYCRDSYRATQAGGAA